MKVHRLLRTIPEDIQRGSRVKVPAKDSAEFELVLKVSECRTEVAVHLQHLPKAKKRRSTPGGGYHISAGVVVYPAHLIEPAPVGLVDVQPTCDGGALLTFADGDAQGFTPAEADLLRQGLGVLHG